MNTLRQRTAVFCNTTNGAENTVAAIYCNSPVSLWDQSCVDSRGLVCRDRQMGICSCAREDFRVFETFFFFWM